MEDKDFVPPKKENGVYKVPCNPKDGVVKTGRYQRIVGRSMSTSVYQEPTDQAQVDLVGDVFHSLYGTVFDIRDPEDVPPERSINRAIMEWAAKDIESARESTIENPLASTVSSGIIWSSLTSDQAVQDALKAQAEAEEARKELEQAIKDAAKSDPNDQITQQSNELRIQRAQQAAQEAAQKGQAIIEKLAGNAMARAITASAVEKGKQAADQVNAVMQTWGIDPGSVTQSDGERIIKIAQDSKSIIKAISELAGRLKGVAEEAAHKTRVADVTSTSEPALTQDILKIFPLELAYMSQSVPVLLRLDTIVRFLDYGLLGWKPVAEEKELGSFLFYRDESGSTNGDIFICESAIGLGLALEVRDDHDGNIERHYELYGFGARGDGIHACYQESSYKDHLDWAEQAFNGGTDFDYVIEHATQRIKDLALKGITNYDVVISTDGACDLSDDVAEAWETVARENNVRLFVISIGNYSTGEIERIATRVFSFGANEFMENAEMIVSGIMSVMAQPLPVKEDW